MIQHANSSSMHQTHIVVHCMQPHCCCRVKEAATVYLERYGELCLCVPLVSFAIQITFHWGVINRGTDQKRGVCKGRHRENGCVKNRRLSKKGHI